MTPAEVINSVVASICNTSVRSLNRITKGGLNETYRASLASGDQVIVRIARRDEPWFTNEESAIQVARSAGIPAPQVLGVHHTEHDGELLSFSMLEVLPGRPLDELAHELPPGELNRLVGDAGALLARLHTQEAGGQPGRQLTELDEAAIVRARQAAAEQAGEVGAETVEQAAAFLGGELERRPAPTVAPGHGDWLPKHLLIDNGAIVGVIDWEFAGMSAPAFDLAHWPVSAGGDLRGHAHVFREGYCQVADPDAAGDGWGPVCAMDFALEILGWQNPASPERIRQCVSILADQLRQR